MLKHIQTNSNGTLDRRRQHPLPNGVIGNGLTPTRGNGTLPNRSNLSTTLRNGSTTAFNISSYSTTSKHSHTSSSVSPCQTATTRTTGLDQSRDPPPSADVTVLNASGHTVLTPPHAAVACSPLGHQLSPRPPAGTSFCQRLSGPPLPRDAAVRRMLFCLGLLCLSSLLLAILASIFLLKVTPLDMDEFTQLVSGYRRTVDAAEYMRLYEVTVALTALSVCLDLCCLLVCSTQLVLCVKLSKSPGGDQKTGAYLRQSSPSRVFAMVGYFLSIPVFLTGVVLYTFLHFHSTSAVTTSVFLGMGILFCAAATAHNVGVWHRVKRDRSSRRRHEKATTSTPHRLYREVTCNGDHVTSGGLPSPTLDLSGHINVSNIQELSTLV